MLYVVYTFSFVTLLLYFTLKNKVKESQIIYFIWYLFAMFFLDFIAHLSREFSNFRNNVVFYNILIFFQYNLILFFYYKVFNNKVVKKWNYILLYLFNICYVSLVLFYGIKYSFLNKYFVITDIIGSSLISIILLLYLRELLNSEKILDYKRLINFWITIGLLVYYLASIPFVSVLNTMANLSKENLDFIYNIQHLLSVFMYACFILGLLWNQKKVK